jgi:hypothetical protein
VASIFSFGLRLIVGFFSAARVGFRNGVSLEDEAIWGLSEG